MKKDKSKVLVFLTVNSSYSHSGMVTALLHQACGSISSWQWKKLEITLEEDPFETAADEEYFPCDLLCATLYLFNREKTLDILRRVKALYPQTHIAVGGPECAAGESAASLLKENPFISTVFTGEGEGVFPAFLEHFEEYGSLRQILVPDGKHGIYEDWASGPDPVTDPCFRTDKAFVQIETSRGCPMGCTYCTSSGVRTRYRSLEQVKETLDLLQAKGVTEVRVLDRTFNLPQSRAEDLLHLFYQYPSIHFHLEIHPEYLGENLKRCLAEAPLHQLHIEAGMQSLSPCVQVAVGRKSSVPEALEGLRYLCSCPNFETHVDLLAGLPEQTFAGLKQDVTELMNCAPGEIQLEILKMLPGTKILNDAERYGIIYNSKAPYEVMRTGSMTSSELVLVKKLSRMLDLFYNHKALHSVLLCAVSTEMEVFSAMFDYVLEQKTEPDTLMNLKKRFLFLGRFLEERSLVPALEELRFQWLESGYPLNEGPVKGFLENVASLPETFTFLYGEKESLVSRESKYYSMKKGDEKRILIFNRKYRFNGPCAWGKIQFP